MLIEKLEHGKTVCREKDAKVDQELKARTKEIDRIVLRKQTHRKLNRINSLKGKDL